ncbi:hypothetical protein [Coraliomargarita sinensis]|nr:hypothetical protein [Coraliomargarita sinensis]
MKEIGRDKFLEQFADSPARLAWAEAYLSDRESVRALVDAVDESPYSLRQWVDAFIVVGQWLDARGLRASFQDQLGYVSCACEAAGAGANLTTLSGVVTEMLDDYGFESAVEQS